MNDDNAFRSDEFGLMSERITWQDLLCASACVSMLVRTRLERLMDDRNRSTAETRSYK